MDMKIDRHKAAISRNDLSKPVFAALQQNVINEGDSVFDYGCGKGDDVKILRKQGYDAIGWDPFHAPENQKRSADIVNLGYVINEILRYAEVCRMKNIKINLSLSKYV